MTNEWKLSSLSSQQEIEKLRILKDYGQEFAMNPIIAQLLVEREITNEKEITEFFKPNIEKIHDPFLYKDMDKAVERLSTAINRNEKIMIYGDYDVDGTTAVALVYKYLFTVVHHINISYYIPNRYEEGYGISYKAIDKAAETNCSLIIALDCGIKAIDKIDYASKRNIDFIICDHHVPDGNNIPNAVAVLDAKRIDNTYPYTQLSGCGVGFKFMQALTIKNGYNKNKLADLLDLVAVSIASDIVPVNGENRILAYFGLKSINSNPCIGLKSIINSSGLKGKNITLSDIVFKIGPKLNASGRIESGNKSVELLISDNTYNATRIGKEIDDFNDTRKNLDRDITIEANNILDSTPDLSQQKGIVVYDSSWHKGVIGIVASRLTEEYYRPSVVLTRTDLQATGSARSVPGFDIYSAIEYCKDLLENFGGHTYAAGLSLKLENIDKFKKKFEQYVSENITKAQLTPTINIDAEISLNDINWDFFSQLKKLEPFGPENEKPIFCIKRVMDYRGSRLVGKNKKHIKLELIDETGRNTINAIAFNKSDKFELVKSRKHFDIAFTIEENFFLKKTSLQLMIKDIRASQ